MRKLTINPQLFQEYPGLVVGIVVVQGADNTASQREIENLLRQAEKKIQNNPEIEPVKQYPPIAAWREAQRKFGNNPNKKLTSVEALVKRVIKGGKLPSINSLVDLYNYTCLTYVVPVGGEDLDTCVGDIELTHADGKEDFIELGGKEQDPPLAGEVVYKDDAGVLCRCWNWHEADRTKLTKDTKNAVLVIEGLPPRTKDNIEIAVKELAQLVEKYCGGKVNTAILSLENHEVEI